MYFLADWLVLVRKALFCNCFCWLALSFLEITLAKIQFSSGIIGSGSFKADFNTTFAFCSTKDLQKMPRKTEFFCIHYFWKKKCKWTKTIMDQCFSVKTSQSAKNYMTVHVAWNENQPKKRYTPFFSMKAFIYTWKLMWKKQLSKTKFIQNHPFLVPQTNGQNINQQVRVFFSYPFHGKKCIVHVQTFTSICGTVSFTLIVCAKVILITTTSSINKLFTFTRIDVVIPSGKSSTAFTNFWQRIQNRMMHYLRNRKHVHVSIEL